MFVGADNLLARRGGRDLRPWIALAFGLVHGFGFAGVLRETGLPGSGLGWSLFSFNLGVEIGQLLVVVVVSSALAALRARSERAGRQLAVAGSVVVAAAGAFWFIERAFFPGGIHETHHRARNHRAGRSGCRWRRPRCRPPPRTPPTAAPAAPKPPEEKVAEIEKVKDNLYMLTKGGGNTAAFITAKGVVVVDTKLAGWGQAILDKIKTVTDKPVTMIINTHTHGDHTGSNEFFGASVEIVVQENTKANMEKMDAFKGDKAQFLPKKTYKDKLSLGSGKDKIDLYYFGPGHTNGDTFVVFPALRVMHAGDMFAGKGTPFIDTRNGGSGVAYRQDAGQGGAGIKRVDTVIPGHSPVMTWNDFKEFAAFHKDLFAWAKAQHKAGKTVDEAAAAYKVPEKYSGLHRAQGGNFGSLKTALSRRCTTT